VPKSPKLSATKHKIRSFFRLKSDYFQHDTPTAQHQMEEDRVSSGSSSGKSDGKQQKIKAKGPLMSEEERQLEMLLSCEAVIGVHYRMAEGYKYGNNAYANSDTLK